MRLVADNIVFALQRVGGISVVWQELLQRAAADPELELTVLDYPNSNVCRQQLDLSGVRCLDMPMRRMERYRVPDFRVDKPLVFHSSYFRVLPQPGVSNITTVHDLTYHFYRHGPARWVHLAEELHALRHSRTVVCVSQHTRRDLLRLYPWLDEQRVRVVYNGVGEHFRPLSNVAQQGYLLYVGNRTVSYKRFDVAVEVARQTGLELVAVGAPATAAEQAKLNVLLGRDRYRVVSGVGNAELNRYYNEALCLLYPSDYEGFGIPLLEAQRAGCPVLAQAISSVPEVAGRAALLVPHRSPEGVAAEMADIVGMLQHGRLDLQQLRQSGFRNAAHYSWDNTYKQTKAIYYES